MKTIEFNDNTYRLLSCGVGWCSARCPHCDYYHSQNFIPNIERDKTSYILPCRKCKADVEVVGSLEYINKLIEWLEYEQQKMEKVRNRKRSKKWEITIEKCRGIDKEEALSVGVQSNTQGMNFSTVSLKHGIDSIRNYVKKEGIQEKDCDLYSDVTTKEEVFGGQTLFAFF